MNQLLHYTTADIHSIRTAAKALTDDELSEAIQDAEESLGEIESQHGAETAMYGDSWPGAQIELSNLRYWLIIYAGERADRNPAHLDAEFNECPVSDYGHSPAGYLN